MLTFYVIDSAVI